MEINLIPFIEAVKGITWQGVVVILSVLAAACYLAKLRLTNAREEREFWKTATPEQIMARAATAATLPPPTKPPPSPVVPLTMLAVFLGCAFMANSTPETIEVRRILHPRHPEVLTAAATCEPEPMSFPIELARVGTGDPRQTPPPSRKLPGPRPMQKDCDAVSCKPPAFCSRGECVGTAKKPPVRKVASARMSAPTSFTMRAAWQDIEPEPFPEPLSDARWLAGVLR